MGMGLGHCTERLGGDKGPCGQMLVTFRWPHQGQVLLPRLLAWLLPWLESVSFSFYYFF